jgi:cyclophilin family peptidyl-prolyl cis-trans isomerase
MKFLAACFAVLLALPAMAANPHVLMKTTLGDIDIELAQDKAPVSVANFLNYAQNGTYAGTIFHRVVPGFVAQGGGYLPNLTAKPTGSPIANESKNGLKNLRGTIAMARTSDPNSATDQFYFNLVDNAGLDYGTAADGYGYAVFGTVVSGMSVVDAMAKVSTTTVSGFSNVPTTPIVIQSVTQIATAPTFTANITATGSITAQTLDLVLTPAITDLGKASYVYIVAIAPNNAMYTLTPAGWAVFDSGKPVGYWSGFLKAQSVNLVTGLDLSGLKGTVIVVGYGFGTNAVASLNELLGSKRFVSAYTIN